MVALSSMILSSQVRECVVAGPGRFVCPLRQTKTARHKISETPGQTRNITYSAAVRVT